MDEERFYLLERCLGFPWWRLEVERGWELEEKKVTGARRKILTLSTASREDDE